MAKAKAETGKKTPRPATNGQDLNASAQVDVLSNLSQAAAAWLVGMNPRTLRDHAGIKRGARGTYDARNLLAWAAGRVKEAELHEDDLEKSLVAADMLFDAMGEYESVAVADYLGDLLESYGEPGLVAFARELTRRFKQRADYMRSLLPAPRSIEERRREIERRVREQVIEEERLDARERLDVVVVCELCGWRRRGYRWVKEEIPENRHVIKDRCPECESGEYGRDKPRR